MMLESSSIIFSSKVINVSNLFGLSTTMSFSKMPMKSSFLTFTPPISVSLIANVTSPDLTFFKAAFIERKFSSGSASGLNIIAELIP